MGVMINRRRVCGGKSLPYDAEIEYLESTGTQYIDTGIITTSETDVQLEYMIKNRALAPIFGIGTIIDNSTYAFFSFYHYGSSVRDNYYINYGRNDKMGTVLPRNTRICVSMNANYSTVTYNATEETVSYSSVWDSEYAKNLFLFRANVNYNYANCNICVYRCKIKNGDILVRDFIPVVKDNVGYLYDKVSGQLFGNAGTGNFILGNDV